MSRSTSSAGLHKPEERQQRDVRMCFGCEEPPMERMVIAFDLGGRASVLAVQGRLLEIYAEEPERLRADVARLPAKPASIWVWEGTPTPRSIQGELADTLDFPGDWRHLKAAECASLAGGRNPWPSARTPDDVARAQARVDLADELQALLTAVFPACRHAGSALAARIAQSVLRLVHSDWPAGAGEEPDDLQEHVALWCVADSLPYCEHQSRELDHDELAAKIMRVVRQKWPAAQPPPLRTLSGGPP